MYIQAVEITKSLFRFSFQKKKEKKKAVNRKGQCRDKRKRIKSQRVKQKK